MRPPTKPREVTPLRLLRVMAHSGTPYSIVLGGRSAHKGRAKPRGVLSGVTRAFRAFLRRLHLTGTPTHR